MFTIHLSAAHSLPLLMSPSCLGVIVFCNNTRTGMRLKTFPSSPAKGKRTYYIIISYMAVCFTQWLLTRSLHATICFQLEDLTLCAQLWSATQSLLLSASSSPIPSDHRGNFRPPLSWVKLRKQKEQGNTSAYLGDSGRLHPRKISKNHKQNAAKFKCKIKLSIPVWKHSSEVFLTKTPNSRCEISWNHTCSRCGDAIIQCKSRTTCLTTAENIIPNKSCKKECILECPSYLVIIYAVWWS